MALFNLTMKNSLVLLMAFVASGGCAQIPVERLDSLARSLSENKYGVSVMLAKADTVLYQKSFGYADLELRVPLSEAHLFRIGSITKQFTAVAILGLHEAGSLHIEDRLAKYLPDFPNADSITIEQLLNHTSGVRNYTELKRWTAEERKRDLNLGELIHYFEGEAPDFKAGTSWRYSDSGYVLLGKVIEKVTGQQYMDYLHQELLSKNGLDQIRYGSTSTIITNRAKGYKEQGGITMNADFLSMTQPHAAGGLLSTVDDLWRWNRKIFSGAIVSLDVLKEAHSETEVGETKYPYGYGWQIDYPQKRKALYHHGWINGFFTTAWYVPSHDLFVAIGTNCTCKDPRALAKHILREYLE